VLRLEDHDVVGGELLAGDGVHVGQAVVPAVVTPVCRVILPARVLARAPVVDEDVLGRGAARVGLIGEGKAAHPRRIVDLAGRGGVPHLVGIAEHGVLVGAALLREAGEGRLVDAVLR